jgi:hypothetical protein
MLFRKDIERCCSYCLYAKVEEENVTCAKAGNVSPDHRCWRFRYDPCKRTPPKMKAFDTEKYDDVDFSL